MENREKAKEKIRRTFIDMVKNTPVEDIQVKELVQLAGVSRSTFYVYYDSIWDILQEIEDEFFASALEIKKPVLEGRETPDSDKIPQEIYQYLLSQVDVMEALTAREGDASYLSTWMKGITQQIEFWIGESLKDSTAQNRMKAEFTIGGVQRMLSYWSTHKEEIQPE